jgi:polyisoprenoid-binding protein YceI
VPAPNGCWLLAGDLTIRAVARPVELVATAELLDGDMVRVRANGKIRRTEFGLDWDALRQAGRLLVAEHVKLTADVVLSRSH